MQRANHRTRDHDERERNTELALAAIYAVLNCNGAWGWDDWNRYAATGEWN